MRSGRAVVTRVQATLTDYEPVVLQCLWRSVGATAALGQNRGAVVTSAERATGHGAAQAVGNGATAGAASAADSVHPPEAQPAPDIPSDSIGKTEAAAGAESDAAFDPEDADSCDDLDDFLRSGLDLSGSAPGTVAADGPSHGWRLVSRFCCLATCR